MTTKVDSLVDRYLEDLEAELADLPANRRRELLDEVGEHIGAARAALDTETEAAVRTVLERLGDPADIAAEARERFGIPVPAARQASPRLEAIALVLLVIPVLGWVVGVVLIWVSRLWTIRDKLIGTLAGMSWVAAGLGTVVADTRSASGAGTAVGSPRVVEAAGPDLLAVVLVVAPFVLPIVAAIYLAIRLRAVTGRLEQHQAELR
jgi:uncharacterized membrane protein